MAWAKYVSFTKQTGTGTQTVSGVGNRGKALILWTTRQTTDGATDGAHLCLGMTDGVNQMARSIVHPDNQSATTSSQSEQTDRIVWFSEAASGGSNLAAVVEGTFTGFTSNGFTINWNTNDGAADIIHCVVFGGDDLQADYVPVKLTVGTGGTIDVTSVGFQPDSFVVIGGAVDEFGAGDYALGAPFGSIHGFGFSNAVDNVCAWTLGRGTGGASDTYRGQHTDRCASLRAANISGASELAAFRITATSSTGFTVTRVAGTTTHQPIQHILALKGIRAAMGTFSSPAATGDLSLSFPFDPKLLLLQSVNSATSGSALNGMNLAIGACDAAGAGAAWIGGTDNANPSVYARSTVSGTALQVRTEAATGSASAIACEATATLGTGTATLTFTTVPGTAAITIQYIAFGDTVPTSQLQPFSNDAEIDLIWVEITDRAGAVHAIAEVDLPDRSAYHHGFKEGLLTEVDAIDRAMTSRYGALEVPTVSFAFFDRYGEWRALADNSATRDFAGLNVEIYGITDEDRRAEQPPRTLWRGVTREHHWDNLVLQFICEDPLSRLFSANNDAQQLPQDSVDTADWPNCGSDRVPSSALGYVVNGAVAAGATEIPVRGGTGQFASGDLVQFAGHTPTMFQAYEVSGSSRTGLPLGSYLQAETAESHITLNHPLEQPLSDGEVITQVNNHAVAPARGTSVPKVYGLISDYKQTAGAANSSLPLDGTLSAPYAFAVNFTGGALNGPVGVIVVAIKDGHFGPVCNPAGTNESTPGVARSVSANWTAVAGAQSYRCFIVNGSYFNPYTGERSSDVTRVRWQDHDATTHDGLPGMGWGNSQEADFSIMWASWTDGNEATSVDYGDGQGPVKFIGDATVGGRTTAWFLWAGHQCYAPGGSPFQGVYCWDRSIDLATYAATGERLIVPGYGRWTELAGAGGLVPNGSTNSTYVTINGHDYTIVGLQGVFRDWALGIAPAPPNLSGAPLAVNAYGRMDANGNLLRNAAQVFKDCLKNYIMGAHRGGALLAAPTYPDGTSILDEASFDTVDAQQQRRLPGGYVADFILGANNERITSAQLIKDLALTNDADVRFNNDIQLGVSMIEDDPVRAVADADTLDDVNDILDEPGHALEIDDQDLDIFNIIRFGHTPDYLGREKSGWRSAETGFNEAYHAASVARHGKLYDQPLELRCIRGKNRDSDCDEYQQGSDTAADILKHRLRRTAEAPRVYRIPTGMRGFNSPFELGRVAYLSHGKNIGGRTLRPVRIQRHTARAGSNNDGRVVVFEAEDLTRLLADPLSLTLALGAVDASASSSMPSLGGASAAAAASNGSGSGVTALTGDVTAGPGSGPQAATIAADAVTNAKLANMAPSTIKGRAAGAGTGDPTDLTAPQATAILDPMVGDTGSGGTKGLVPAPAAGDAAAGKFLKADGTWTAPSGSGTVTTTGTPANGNLAKFSGGSSITNGDLSGEVTTSGTLVTTINPAATPQVARFGIGAAADAAAKLKVAGQYYSPEITDTVSAGAATVDWNAGNEHMLVLTANTALTFSNPKGGGRYVLLLQQDGTGSRTVTWPASVLWPSGTTPTLTTTANKTDLFTFIFSAVLGKYIGNAAFNF